MIQAINITGLNKKYGAKPALKDVSLSVNQGAIFGFLGPNGDSRIELSGLRVPKAIDNLEFSFDFSDNRFTVRRTLEDTTSLNFFKTAFLEARRSYRIGRGYYSQDYLMSQLQARILSEFLEQLEAGEIPF